MRLKQRHSVFASWSLVLLAALLSIAGAAHADDQELWALDKQVRALVDAQNLGEAERLGKQLAERARELHGEASLAYAAAAGRLSDVYWEQDRFLEAEKWGELALQSHEKVVGPDNVSLASPLNQLATIYGKRGKVKEGIALTERALALIERDPNRTDEKLALMMANLAAAHVSNWSDPERFVKWVKLYQRVYEIRLKAFGPEHALVAETLEDMANIYPALGMEAEAEKLLLRALEMSRKHRREPSVRRIMGSLASLYRDQGKPAESLELYEQRLALAEKMKARDPATKQVIVAGAMHDVAALYSDLGRYAEAVALHERVLATYTAIQGADSPGLANSLRSLGFNYRQMGRLKEAEAAYVKMLALLEKAHGADTEEAAEGAHELATLYRDLGRYDEAQRMAERALRSVDTMSRGEASSLLAQRIATLGSVLFAAGRYAEAEQNYARALSVLDSAPPGAASAPYKPQLEKEFAALKCATGEADAALTHARKAASFFAEVAERGSRAGSPQLAYYAKNAFPTLACAAYKAAEHAPAQRDALSNEAFVGAQYDDRAAAASALAQMAVRASAGDPKLASAVRQQQDLNSKWQALDKQLSNALSTSDVGRDSAKIDRLRRERAETERQATAATEAVGRGFPDFAALTSPKPLSLSDVRTLLKPDEALVAFLVGEDASYVWAMTADGSDWRRIEIGKKALGAKVAALRKPLDLWAQSPRGLARLTAESSGCAPVADARGLVRVDASAGAACEDGADFSLKLAHELYATLLAPIADTIKGKSHLMIVPSGPLSGLPFNALITEPAAEASATVAAFRQAPWIIKRHAVTVLPAVSSLKVLRALGHSGQAAKPFVGFGDPDFSGKSGTTRGKRKAEQVVAEAGAPLQQTATQTRGLSDFFRGGTANVEALRQGLPPLPDTADELRTIAHTLNAEDGDVILGSDATERTIKTMSTSGQLASYQVVAFATHGLVAGELQGLAEPAIALTVPAKPSEADDGLLTASEAANLKLDADWVILSACNTAAGGSPDAQALSGLSRAFFYAGTRALLVSHWQVDSAAAVKLTTGTFAALKDDPGLGRSGAFRQAMLRLVDKGEPYQAHPAYWAPFFVVGEGGAR